MNIFDILNNLRVHGISPSGIPSNISSMANHKIVNDISKLRAKLSSDEYKQASTLYKKVIKPINIAFIRSLYTMQNYGINNNYDPITDFDYLLDQYDRNVVKNPAIYKLLKKNLLQRNLFKYIIIMHYSNKSENNIYDKIIGILKGFIGERRRMLSPGIMEGGAPVLTEDQKKLLVTTIVFCALAINDEKTRNSFKELIKEVDNSNSKQIIERIDKAVADTSISIERKPFLTASIINPDMTDVSSSTGIKKEKSIVDPIISEGDSEKLKEEIKRLQDELARMKPLDDSSKTPIIVPSSESILESSSASVKSSTVLTPIKTPESKGGPPPPLATGAPTPATGATGAPTSPTPGAPTSPTPGAPTPPPPPGGPPPPPPPGGPPPPPPPPGGPLSRAITRDPIPGTPEYPAFLERKQDVRRAQEADEEKKKEEKLDADELKKYNEFGDTKEGIASKINFNLIKPDYYKDKIKEWISRNEFYRERDKNKNLVPSGDLKSFYDETIKKIEELQRQILAVQRENNSNRSIYKQDIATKKKRVSQTEKLLEEIKKQYKAAELRHKQYMEDDFWEKRCVKRKEDLEPKQKTKKKPESEKPLIFTAKIARDAIEDKINERKDTKFLTEYQTREINIKKIIQKNLVLENELEEKNIKDEYKEKIRIYITETKDYNEEIINLLSKINKDTNDTEYNNIKTRVKQLFENIDEAEEDIAIALKQKGGSLFYYQKYMKYKSKYLQIK